MRVGDNVIHHLELTLPEESKALRRQAEEQALRLGADTLKIRP